MQQNAEALSGIAFAQGQPQIALRVEIKGARAAERHIFESRAIGRRRLLTSACQRSNHAGLQINDAHAMVQNIGHIKRAIRPELQTVRLVKLRCLS